MPEGFETVLETAAIPRLLSSAIILILAFLAVRVLNRFWERWRKEFLGKLEKKCPASISSIDTKITITRKITGSLIYFIAIVLFLLQFDVVRSLGAGLLASAGVAGLIIGMAAQNTISNMIAGVSISFAQPVRLNDAVIFEGDFGWVEDILLMHTVIRTWDNRRVMVPNSVLVSKVLQNWTIRDPSLLGIVMLYVDFTCDVEIIRTWVSEIVNSSSNSTEERVASVQVVDFTEMTMVLRILTKGPDAPTTWALRCELREKLMNRFREAGLPLPRARRETVPVQGKENQI